jgi:predicted metallo-beta-lactamase superfamily hydrolase
MPENVNVQFLALVWTIVTVLFAGGAAYGAIRYAINRHEKELEAVRESVRKTGEVIEARVENHEHYIRGVLFRPDSTSTYLPRQECESCRMACQSRIDARLIAMQNVIESSEKKRDAAVERWTSAFADISKQIGRLEGRLSKFGSGGPQ